MWRKKRLPKNPQPAPLRRLTFAWRSMFLVLMILLFFSQILIQLALVAEKYDRNYADQLLRQRGRVQTIFLDLAVVMHGSPAEQKMAITTAEALDMLFVTTQSDFIQQQPGYKPPFFAAPTAQQTLQGTQSQYQAIQQALLPIFAPGGEKIIPQQIPKMLSPLNTYQRSLLQLFILIDNRVTQLVNGLQALEGILALAQIGTLAFEFFFIIRPTTRDIRILFGLIPKP